MNAERKLALWVDRVGGGKEKGIQAQMRILGQYAAVKIEEGAGRFINTVSGEERVEAGNIMLLFPDVPCMYYPDDCWTVKWILWNGPEAALLEKLGFMNRRKPVVRQNCQAMDSAHSLLMEITGREDLMTILERKSIILDLARELCRAGNASAKQKATDKMLEKAISHIDSQESKNLSIKELASISNMSITHFRRLFKAYAGRSPKEYILASKISRAKKCLIEGHSIKEVAEMLGFCDVFHFMRTFKKVAGVNPGSFR